MLDGGYKGRAAEGVLLLCGHEESSHGLWATRSRRRREVGSQGLCATAIRQRKEEDGAMVRGNADGSGLPRQGVGVDSLTTGGCRRGHGLLEEGAVRAGIR